MNISSFTNIFVWEIYLYGLLYKGLMIFGQVLSTVSVDRQILHKARFNGKEAGIYEVMSEQKFEGNEFIQKGSEAMPDLEARYEERGYTPDLPGIEKINKKRCYKPEFDSKTWLPGPI